MDTATVKSRTVSCSSSTTFTDDNTNAGLYFDEKARRDSVVICPSSSGRQVKVSFRSFDVAGGDALSVYDGDFLNDSSPFIGSASGNGASNAFGSWVVANCDPSINPSGCLSFIFETNGDNAKGNGWEASVTCESSGTKVECPRNITEIDDCNNLDGMVTVTITKPTFTTCGGSSFAMVSLTSTCSSIPSGSVLADGGILGTFTIPLGTHQITATSLADNSQRCSYLVVADQPTLACNDNVTSGIGFGCSGSIRVDDVIENPCVGTGTTYRLAVDLGRKGTLSVEVDGSSFSTLNATSLDIPSENFDCGTEYAVEVTRIVRFSGCGTGDSVSKSCTGRVKFVDNEGPTIFVSSPTLTTCGNLSDAELKKLLTINVSDNCAVKDTTVTIGSFPSNFCSSNLTVPITVTAVDFCGNTSTERINAKVVRPTNFFRPKDTVLTCGSGFDPSIAGYPLLDTDGDNIGDLPIIDNTCNFIPLFTDQRVEANNSKTIKIFRTWQIKDWCDQKVPVTLEPQVIEIKDTGKPAINCPSGNQLGTPNNPNIVTTGFNNCTATLNIVAPTASDDCGGAVSVDFEYAIDLSDDSRINNVTGIPIGSYFAVYFGRDETGNRSDTCRVYFDVVDSNAPQATCVDELNVSFVNNIVTLRVEDIAVNNSDNCGELNQQIRKEGGTWGPTVSLTCAEVEASNKIYLRVLDGSGGENTCWTLITAKDASVPECQSLADRTLACEDYHNDQFGGSTDANDNKVFDNNEWQALTGSLESLYNQEFGNPDCSDAQACGTVSIEQQYQVIQAQCGETKIRRRYRSTDNGSNHSSWRTQNITLTFTENFSVTFAADWNGDCGDNFPKAAINLDANGCSVIAWTHTDKRFDGVSDGCYLIERTYSVTNWCYHEAGQTAMSINRIEDNRGFSNGITLTQDDLQNVGLLEYIQVLRVSDTDAPIITINNTDECIAATTCSATKTFSISADDCLGTEALTYSYELSREGTVVESGTSASFTTAVSPADYAIKWTVTDNCGNSAVEATTYTFKDCKKPTPFCLDGVATTVDNNGNAQVWAVDINQKSEDNCTSEDKLELRIYHPVLGDAVQRPEIGDEAATVLALPTNVTLTCDQLGNQTVELYVVDEAGNWDFCTGSVFIQDGSGACGGNLLDSTNVAMLAGGIISMNNIPVANVELTAKGTALYEQKVTTDDSGIFSMNLPKGIGYVISFNKEGDPANGMTVFDIIMVSKHILGITPFESPYQFIAADVNNSSSVTAFDLVLMRKIILGIDEQFEGNTPWRFFPVGGELTIPGSGDIANLSETIVINNLTDNQDALDYVAIKIGDLNASVQVDGFKTAEDRYQNTLSITTQNKIVKAGEKVAVTFSQKELAALQGLQFGLQFEDLTLENIDYGQVQKQHLAQLSDNELTIVWDKFSADKNADLGNDLLTLNFVAQQNGQLSEFVQISSKVAVEGVTNRNELTNITLNFEKPATSSNFKLYQNTPNPFTNATNIGFELSEKGPISLEIYTLQGALIQQINGTFNRGYHEVTIQKADLRGNGVLLYQLTTPSGVASKKMILLD
ncbi:MAG: T9SS type A sorting domain-containing protein [Bacteroidota bacterium]